MSNQHDDTGSKPQVLDLEAEEIRSEADSPPRTSGDETREDAYAPATPKKTSRGTSTWIIAALILGALGGGWQEPGTP